MGTDRARVMVVEDDATVRTVVGDYLRAAGYEVALYSEGRSARAALRSDLPDVLVVDRMLPGVSGDELCREVRKVSALPIIMLTALGAVEQRIQGLERGADDYVTKPFALKELRLRVDAQLRRRTPAPPADTFTVGHFRVDPSRRCVWRGGEEITLTTREYELLLYCVRHPDQVLARDDILGKVWGWSFGDSSTVTVHVRRLREKIEPEPRYPVYLRTEWGVGYRFAPWGHAR